MNCLLRSSVLCWFGDASAANTNTSVNLSLLCVWQQCFLQDDHCNHLDHFWGWNPLPQRLVRVVRRVAHASFGSFCAFSGNGPGHLWPRPKNAQTKFKYAQHVPQRRPIVSATHSTSENNQKRKYKYPYAKIYIQEHLKS